MSEYFPAEIHIGGPISRAALPDLFRAICAEGVSLKDYDGPQATEESLEEAFREGQVVRLCDAQACYGQFDALEAFLVEQRIHFDRHSDAFCEFSAENVHYRGEGEPLITPADQRGNSLVPCSEVLAVLNGSQDPDAKLIAIRNLVDPPQAAPLTPIRFV